MDFDNHKKASVPNFSGAFDNDRMDVQEGGRCSTQELYVQIQTFMGRTAWENILHLPRFYIYMSVE